MRKRQVEVFTAGCPVCEPAVQLVKQTACPDCDVSVHDLRRDTAAAERAGARGVHRLPAIVVDGNLLACCRATGPSREEVVAAGVGEPLS